MSSVGGVERPRRGLWVGVTEIRDDVYDDTSVLIEYLQRHQKTCLEDKYRMRSTGKTRLTCAILT